MARKHTSRCKLPTKRERKKEKKASEDPVWPRNHQNRGFDGYDPPNKPVELNDKLIEKIVAGNAMLMYGLGSRLHYQLASFSRRELKRLWNSQQGKCAVSGLELYGPPDIGPGGIGIDIINYKRRQFESGNIRIVSSFFAYTRHVSKHRRFILKNTLSDGWIQEYNIYDAIWTHIFKGIKERKVFKFLPVMAEIEENFDRPGSSEITFTFHLTKLNSGDGRVERFCKIRLENDYFEVLTPEPKNPPFNPMTQDRPNIPSVKFPLSDPNICPIDAILTTATDAFEARLQKYLRSVS